MSTWIRSCRTWALVSTRVSGKNFRSVPLKVISGHSMEFFLHYSNEWRSDSFQCRLIVPVQSMRLVKSMYEKAWIQYFGCSGRLAKIFQIDDSSRCPRILGLQSIHSHQFRKYWFEGYSRYFRVSWYNKNVGQIW